MHAHLMCMKLALLASTVYFPHINIMKCILFALKRDATLTCCPVLGDEIESREITKGVSRVTSR